MRVALRMAVAAAIAGAYAYAEGFLAMRAHVLRIGLELGWSGEPRIVDPQFPVLYASLTAVLSATVASYILWRLLRAGRSGYAEVGTFVAVLLVAVVWGVLTYEPPEVAVQTLDLTGETQWRYGVLSPALHTVMVLPVVVAIGQGVKAAVARRALGSVGRDGAPDAPDGNPYAPPRR